MGDTRGTVLVAAGVAAIGVALRVADEDGKVGFKYGLVHYDPVAARSAAEINEGVIVLRVVAGYLIRGIELSEKLVAEYLPRLLAARAGVEAVGEEQEDIFFLNAGRVQLLEQHLDGDLAVRGGLDAALYYV